jgi:aminoglycoside phosphotransferase (APT) family kinase protein
VNSNEEKGTPMTETLEQPRATGVEAAGGDDPVRAMTELLTGFLAARGVLHGGAEVRGVRRLIGGYSREMWYFDIVREGGTESFVLRMDPPELTTMLVTDRVQEWRFLTALQAEGTVRVPGPRWIDERGDELGRPAIIMDRVAGRNSLELWRDDSDEDRDLGRWEARAVGLAKLLASYTRVELDSLPASVERPASWSQYMASCEERWRTIEAAYPEPVPLLRYIAGWLEANRPEPVALSLVHGDMQPNNVLIDAEERFYAVDWEMTHVGDPREDLGWWLFTELSNPAPFVSLFLDRVCETYRAETGLTESQLNPDVLRYFTVAASLGCFEDIMEQLTAFTGGRTQATNVGYVAVALPFMHSSWMRTITEFMSATDQEVAR